MRRYWCAALVCAQLFALPWIGQAQNGMQAVPVLKGVFVRNSAMVQRITAGIALGVAQQKTYQEILRSIRICADSNDTANRLEARGLQVAAAGLRLSWQAMNEGRCQVYITDDFNFALFGNQDREPLDPVDRTAPVVTPLETRYRSQKKAVQVQVRVEDKESRIASVTIDTPWSNPRRQKMDPVGSDIYQAWVTLPDNYKEGLAVIEARSSAEKPGVTRVSVARVPYCGQPDGVGKDLVRSVQRRLECVGHATGGVDGDQGPKTCAAIGKYLGNEMRFFDAGRLSWRDLDQRLERDCALAQPIELAFSSPVTRDQDSVRVQIDLKNGASAQAITLTRQSGQAISRPWQGVPEPFQLSMPQPGAEDIYYVDVFDKTGKLRDRETLVLQRPRAVLQIEPSGRVERDTDRTFAVARVTVGASAVAQIEARVDGQILREPYAAIGTGFDLQMPRPGGSAQVMFVALNKQGAPLARAALVLERPAPELPAPDAQTTAPDQPQASTTDPAGPKPAPTTEPARVPLTQSTEIAGKGRLPVVDGETPPPVPPVPVLVIVEAKGGPITDADQIVLRIAVQNPGDTRTIVLTDQASGAVLGTHAYTGPVLEAPVPMPDAGGSLVVTVAAQDAGNTPLAGSQIALARTITPATSVPIWYWIAGLGVFLLGGVLGLGVRGSGASAAQSAAPVVTPRIHVKTDLDPVLTLPAGDLPALVFRVDNHGPVVVDIKMEDTP